MTDSPAHTIPPGLAFPETMDLPALQRHMVAFCAHFGWDKMSDEKAFLLFIEEVGELAKAMRKIMRLAEEVNPNKPVLDEAARRQNLSEEFSDVLSYLLELASRFGIDLEQAYRDKVGRDMQREWH